MKTIVLRSIFSAAAALYFGASASAITIDISTVGDPGNAADSNGFGSVDHVFGIGTYDVTLTQYTAFLNSVAATDTYSLYNPALATDLNVAGIDRAGSAGSYTYSVKGDGQRPVTYVSWLDAARFCNWLSNGQPTGAQGAGTTETGAYTLNGDVTVGTETKNLLATWYIPSEDEWYKAAYYDPNMVGGPGYTLYATRNNADPGNVMGGGLNQANYLFNGDNYVYSTTQDWNYDPGLNYLTPVGAFTASASACGTYDQSGNVWNWNDAVVNDAYRAQRGGSWSDSSNLLQSGARYIDNGSDESPTVGFRVATSEVPEPVSGLLIGLGTIILAARRRR